MPKSLIILISVDVIESLKIENWLSVSRFCITYPSFSQYLFLIILVSELYKHLFEEKEVDNLHNSLVDAMVCLRCYLKMRVDHYMEEEEFNNIIKKLI